MIQKSRKLKTVKNKSFKHLYIKKKLQNQQWKKESWIKKCLHWTYQIYPEAKQQETVNEAKQI